MAWPSLPARNLDCPELEALVNQLAGEPDVWRGLTAYSDDDRHYVSLYRDDYVDVYA